MNAHAGLSASDVLGQVDAQKVRSCLTLFAHAAAADPVFVQALARYFSGKPDAATLAMLAEQQG